jgi:aminopeptidase N
MGSLLGDAGGALGPQAPGHGKPKGGAAQLEGMMDLQLEFTVDHEVAHQYFAGIVGNDSRRQPSLDEPLAQYLAGLAYADRHGAAAATRAMDLNVRLNYALYRLLGGADAPVARDTTAFRTPLEYAALVYGKAPYLYQSLGRTLGEAKLHAAMRAVVTRHRFGLLTTAEWRDALAKEAGAKGPEVERAFRRWLDEAHGDEDLKVDDSGDLVMRELFPPEVQEALRTSLAVLGMKPRDLLRMLFGGGLGGGGPTGPTLDVEGALKKLLGE